MWNLTSLNPVPSLSIVQASIIFKLFALSLTFPVCFLFWMFLQIPVMLLHSVAPLDLLLLYFCLRCRSTFSVLTDCLIGQFGLHSAEVTLSPRLSAKMVLTFGNVKKWAVLWVSVTLGPRSNTQPHLEHCGTQGERKTCQGCMMASSLAMHGTSTHIQRSSIANSDAIKTGITTFIKRIMIDQQ